MGSPLMHRYEILQDFAKSFIAEYVPFLFTEYAYVIENGSEGNFPHIHMVFQCNPKLNAAAPTNIWLISVTCPTFHSPIGWLNAAAPENIDLISVTCPTFHS